MAKQARNQAMDRIAATFEALIDQKRYILVNPMEEWAKPTWNGTVIHVPPRDEIVQSSDYYESYRDPATKEYIPGTLCVWDLLRSTPVGDEKAYDITRAIRESLGIQRLKDGAFVYTREWGAAGLGVVMDGASREEIEEVRANGNLRYREHTMATLLMKVKSHESMNQNRLRYGLNPLPEPQDITDARVVINALDRARQERLLKRFDLENVKGASTDLGRGEAFKIPGAKDAPAAGAPATS